MTGMQDPFFLSELKLKVKDGVMPVAPLSKTAAIRKSDDTLKPSVAGAISIHAFVFMISMLPHFFPGIFVPSADPEAVLKAKAQKSAIRVDLVGLPSLRIDELNKIDPTEDVGVPLPEPEPVVESKKEESSKNIQDAKVSETAMKMPDKQSAKKEETKAKPKQNSREEARKRLETLRKKLQSEQRRKEALARLQGKGAKPGGRPALSGNVISEGYSVTGDVATDLDVYNGKVKAHVRRSWAVPGWMAASNLKARILVKIAPDGRILSKNFLSRSGNAEFDQYVESAVLQSEPFPPPPPTLQAVLIEEGIEWGFPE